VLTVRGANQGSGRWTGTAPRSGTHVRSDAAKAAIGSRFAGRMRPTPPRSTAGAAMLTDYAARWALLGVCALVAVDWLLALRVSVNFASILPKLEILVVPLVLSAIYAGIGNKTPGLRRPLAIATDYFLSLFQLLVAVIVLLPLTYLAATTGFPLVDHRLVQLDALVGFDWDSAARWVGERPAIDWILQRVYFSIPWQAAAVLPIGSFRLDRNSEILWLLIVGVLLTCAIFTFTPAVGKIGHLGPGYLDLLTEIRRGEWSTMSYGQSEGIVTFPSFHTTLAIMLTYAVRRHRWALAVFVALNCLMILSIPTVGGHYLVDVFAGAAVAGLAILLVHMIRRATRGEAP
jgi:hypothetical protein